MKKSEIMVLPAKTSGKKTAKNLTIAEMMIIITELGFPALHEAITK